MVMIPLKTPETEMSRIAASLTRRADLQFASPADGGAEHLQRGHALQAVDELSGQRPVAIGPEPHPRAQRPVLARREEHHHSGEHGHARPGGRVDDDHRGHDRGRGQGR